MFIRYRCALLQAIKYNRKKCVCSTGLLRLLSCMRFDRIIETYITTA